MGGLTSYDERYSRYKKTLNGNIFENKFEKELTDSPQLKADKMLDSSSINKRTTSSVQAL